MRFSKTSHLIGRNCLLSHLRGIGFAHCFTLLMSDSVMGGRGLKKVSKKLAFYILRPSLTYIIFNVFTFVDLVTILTLIRERGTGIGLIVAIL